MSRNYATHRIVIGLAILLTIALSAACVGVVELEEPVAPIPVPEEAQSAVEPDEALASEPGTTLDTQLRAAYASHDLTGDPARWRDIPSIEDPVAQLGKMLFFSKALGGDMDSACVSCHLPTLGGGDGLSLSIGVGAHNPDLIGPGRTHIDGEPNVPRNAPTTFNIALWDKVLFHDGRVESLGKTAGLNGADGMGIRTPDTALGEFDPHAGENLAVAQARFPVTSKHEMLGFEVQAEGTNQEIRDYLAARLGGYGEAASDLDFNEWFSEFQACYGPAEMAKELVSDAYIARAIGTYERSQLFIDNPWFAYVNGSNQALSEDAKKGALLFYTDVAAGGAGCAECHTGDLFSDELYHVLAVPQIGPGKGDGVTKTDDFGRFRETRRLEDLYAFRTPSLLNIEVTGPYGHDGAYTTLEGMVRHHLNPADAVANYDVNQLDPAIQVEDLRANTMKAVARLEYNRETGLPSLQDVDLDAEEVEQLMQFLYALTDPCVTDAECLAPWMPQPGEPNPDRLQVPVALAVGE